MSYPDSGDDDASSAADLSRLFGNGLGQALNGVDPLAFAKLLLANRAQVPADGGGLFGGDYARFMASQTAPASPAPPAGTPMGGAPPTDPGAGADAGAEPAPSASSPSVVTDASGTAAPAPNITVADVAQTPDEGSDPIARPAASTSGAPGPNAQRTAPTAWTTDDEQKALRDVLLRDEGERNVVYPDSVHHLPTVGLGHKVVPADHLKLGDRVDEARIQQFFRDDTAQALAAAHAQAAQAGISDPAFIVRLASVNYQLGSKWGTTFKDAWKDIVRRDYGAAANEVALGSHGGKSLWIKQTPTRVKEFQDALRALAAKTGP